MKRVFQTVGQNGAKLGVGNEELPGQPGFHLQPDAHAPGFIRKGRAQQIEQFVFTKPLGRNGVHISLHFFDVLLRLLRLVSGQKAFNSGQMMAHIMLIDSDLGFHAPQSLHLDFRLFQLRLQHGALQLGVRPGLHLLVIGGEKQYIKDDESGGEKLIQRPNPHGQRVGVHHGGVVKKVVGHGQAAEQQQRLGGCCHRFVGGAHKITAQQQENGEDHQGVADLPRQGRAGDGGDHQIGPPGRLAAQIGRTHADQRDAHRLFQREDQNEHQRQMHDQGVELLGGIFAEHQPAGGLDQQEQRAQDQDQPLLAAVFPPARNEGAEEQPVDQHQPVIKRAQRGQKRHGLTPLFPQTADSCIPFAAAGTAAATPGGSFRRRCARRRGTAPTPAAYSQCKTGGCA